MACSVQAEIFSYNFLPEENVRTSRSFDPIETKLLENIQRIRLLNSANFEHNRSAQFGATIWNLKTRSETDLSRQLLECQNDRNQTSGFQPEDGPAFACQFWAQHLYSQQSYAMEPFDDHR